jgi:endonuclease YncB( thermonuclease family)
MVLRRNLMPRMRGCRGQGRTRQPVGRIAALVLLSVTAPVAADYVIGWAKASDDCRFVRVIDGDTVAMACAKAPQTRLRLADIDTPELRGACWQERLLALHASLTLRWQLYRAGRIEVALSGRTDRYGRALGGLLTDGVPVSEALLDAGLARPYVPSDIAWCDQLTGAAS